MNKNKQLMINMIASLISCIVSLCISFFLTPYIQQTLGYEAVGYTGLATEFTNYAAIIAMALNSMASRFITIKIHQNDMPAANTYFNSVLFANIGIATCLFAPAVIILYRLEHLINISADMMPHLFDIKLLFTFMFINFMVTIIGTTFSVATFAANRLDLSAMRTIESNLFKAVFLIGIFALFPVKMSYVGLATLLCTIYILITNMYYTKKLFPNMQYSRRFFEIRKVFEIISAGIWNTVLRAGQTLTNGIDLMITNLWISDGAMGRLQTAKTIATAIATLYDTVSAVFTPSLTIYYAKGQMKELVDELKSSMKLTGFFANIPLCFMIAFGIPFYQLWMPLSNTVSAADHTLLYELTVLTMFGTIVGGAISPLFSIFTVVNKLKVNSLVILGMGFFNVAIVFMLLHTTNLGIYAVASVSTCLGMIKNLTFTPMYASHCLKISKMAFYPVIIRYVFVSILMSAIFMLCNYMIPVTSWLTLMASVIYCGIIGSVINIVFLFGKKERAILLDILKRH